PGQTTAGFLLAWPTGGAVPPVSILNWDHVPAQIANAAVVPTDTFGTITVNVSAPTHVIMDINGYYAKTPASPNSFRIETSAGVAIRGQTNSTAGLAIAIHRLAAATPGGVGGALHHRAGTRIGEGDLGTSFGTAGDAAAGAWAVCAGGAVGASGAKHFVEPHPEDPNKVILYSSLEGRTVDTYFRGTARFV